MRICRICKQDMDGPEPPYGGRYCVAAEDEPVPPAHAASAAADDLLFNLKTLYNADPDEQRDPIALSIIAAALSTGDAPTAGQREVKR